MKATSLGLALLLFTVHTATAQGTAAPGSQAPKGPIASVESRWGEVYCDITQLSRTANELSLRYQYRNQGKQPFRLPNAELIPYTRIFDPNGMTLYGVMKDAGGKPLSSTMLDGALSRPVPPGKVQAHWARFEPPGEAVKTVTVLIEGCLPLDNVAIGGTTPVEPVSTPATAIASQDGAEEGLLVEVVKMARSAGGLLDVVVRYKNTGSAKYRFPSAASGWDKRFGSVYVVDGASRKKFEVAKDKAGKPLGSDTIEHGGGSLGEILEPGEWVNLWAKLAAPAASTKTVTLYAALAPPFDDVPISGAGGGSSGGSAVAGAVVGVDAALKELGAKVTAAEIRIDLSADVLFDFDKAEIKKEAEGSLRNVATVLNANPGAKVTIEGHTDAKGADAYNQKLSEARAASVKQWLVANAQIDGSRVSTRGWGKTKPVAHNAKPDGSDDPEGRAKNRRVEIVVQKG